MIKNIIFDFGDVFINLDKPAIYRAFSTLGDIEITPEIEEINTLYEIGKITTNDFLEKYQNIFPNSTKQQRIDAWNSILIDFPEYRLEFLKNLAAKKKYKLILLSNTNELHINWIKENITFYAAFKSCFDSFYLSHEIHLRKPNSDIFKFVLNQDNIQPDQTIFIDDTKENTDAAAALGIHTWNNNPKTDDIVHLFTQKSDLF